MRCTLIASFAAAACVSAVRLDEEKLPPTLGQALEAEKELPADSPGVTLDLDAISTSEAQHGAAKLHQGRTADVKQALTAAHKHTVGVERIADQAKKHALKRSGKHAVKFDQAVEVQEEATEVALKATMRRDRLLDRAEATREYKGRADENRQKMIGNLKEKKTSEELHMESAVGAAREEEDAKDAWRSADSAAKEAHVLAEEATEKFEKDKETAENAAMESEALDKELSKKATVAKALASRAAAKKVVMEEANEEKADAMEAEKEASHNERLALEKASGSEEEEKQAISDRKIADQTACEKTAAEKAANENYEKESAVAGQVNEDAVAATEVHEETMDLHNQAALEAGKAKLQTVLRSSAEKATAAEVLANKAAELAAEELTSACLEVD